jgi:hypothetical protein
MAYEPYDYFGQFMAPLQRQQQIDIQQQQVTGRRGAGVQARTPRNRPSYRQMFQSDAQSGHQQSHAGGLQVALLKYPADARSSRQAWDQHSEGQKSRTRRPQVRSMQRYQTGAPISRLSDTEGPQGCLAQERRRGPTSNRQHYRHDLVVAIRRRSSRRRASQGSRSQCGGTGQDRIDASGAEQARAARDQGTRRPCHWHDASTAEFKVDCRGDPTRRSIANSTVGPDGRRTRRSSRVGGDGEPMPQLTPEALAGSRMPLRRCSRTKAATRRRT